MSKKTIQEWQEEVHALAREKGWWDGVELPLTDPHVIGTKVALIHSELSEAYNEAPGQGVCGGKKTKPLGFAVEIADAVIRILDLCAAAGQPVRSHACSWQHAANGFNAGEIDAQARVEALKLGSQTTDWFNGCEVDARVGGLLEAHAAVSEALECVRTGGVGDRFFANMASAIGACAYIAEVVGFDLWDVVAIKHEYNKTRQYRHGGKTL